MHGLLIAAALQVPFPMPAQPGFGPAYSPFYGMRLPYDESRIATPAELAMARVLIMSPVGRVDSVPSGDDWPRVSAAIHQAAIAMEILDPAERVYIGAESKDLQVDFNILRDRWQDVGHGPRLCDANKFSFTRADCTVAIEFNRAVRRRLEMIAEAEADRRHEVRDAISLVDAHYSVWDSLRDSKCDYYHVTPRRQALKRLKQLIGPDDWAAGRMPLAVPVELFKEMP